jgi:hypothetical protein
MRAWSSWSRTLVLLGALDLAPASAVAEPSSAPDDSTVGRVAPARPAGGDAPPRVTGLFGNTRLGGYIEGGWTMEREAGVMTESGFELTRMALVLATNLHQRVQVTTEVEIEDGGEEIELELAQADFAFRRGLGFRAGVLLVPLGKFNLAHDGPRTELPQRPVVATGLLGSALSQPGLGAMGEFAVGTAGRLSYQGYSVTGYGSGVLSSDGTRLPAGQKNFEDENNSPAWVGLIECSPGPGHSVALSGYTGAYNVHRVEGVDVDERRDVRVVVGDLDTHVGPLRLTAEGALVDVDIPGSLSGIYASRQSGAYMELSLRFLDGWLGQGSRWTAVTRFEGVDFDRDLPGDSTRSLTFGINLRPIEESCVKLAFTRGETRDRFNNQTPTATVALGVATYF